MDKNSNQGFDFSKLLKDGTIGSVLSSIGKVASIFNPAIGSGIMMVSNLTDNMSQVDDKFLENEVVGLVGMAQRIEKMVLNKEVDYAFLELVVHNMRSISDFNSKSAKMIG